MAQQDSSVKTIRTLQRALIALAGLLVLASFLILGVIGLQLHWIVPDSPEPEGSGSVAAVPVTKASDSLWHAPAQEQILADQEAALLQYGQDLIANTALYLGPKGKVAYISNGMNCQNCHLEAGKKPWGNNYGAVAATYPKLRKRSGMVENTTRRVNDCFERSLNGKALDTNSREMKAMVAYIQFLGRDVPKGVSPPGSGLWKVPLLDRAADPDKGKIAYQQKCVACHGAEGQGIPKPDGTGYAYPPLWGQHSFNQGAGLFRLSGMAGYIKANMPLGATWDAPQLSDEEAWDIAAFINSQPRPTKDLSKDWPSIAAKPFDHPFGPYADPFSEKQHKLGPFAPIRQWQEQHKDSGSR